MDLGFAGLIEEIEKRFGPFVTNLVLVMLMIGICVWVMKLLLGFLVEIETLKASVVRQEEFVGWVLHIGILVLFMAIVFGVSKYLERRLARRLAEGYGALRKKQDKFQKLLEHFNAEVDAHRAEKTRLFGEQPPYVARSETDEPEKG